MATEACPAPRGMWLDAKTGERVPTPCRRLACEWCGPRAALSTAWAIELAAPRGSAVVMLPRDDDPSGDRARLRAFGRLLGAVAGRIRADGTPFEYCWVIELSESLVPHAHVLVQDHLSSHRFRKVLAAEGARGDLQSVRSIKVLSRYTLKLPIAALDFPFERAAAAMRMHLELNGGKILHATRKFWRYKAQPLSGVREARVVARLARPRGRRPTPEELAKWRSGWKLPTFEDGRGE
jgi:hypothetical protein